MKQLGFEKEPAGSEDILFTVKTFSVDLFPVCVWFFNLSSLTLSFGISGD